MYVRIRMQQQKSRDIVFQQTDIAIVPVIQKIPLKFVLNALHFPFYGSLWQQSKSQKPMSSYIPHHKNQIIFPATCSFHRQPASVNF